MELIEDALEWKDRELVAGGVENELMVLRVRLKCLDIELVPGIGKGSSPSGERSLFVDRSHRVGESVMSLLW